MKKKNLKIFAGVLLLAACPAMSVYADETGIVKADALNVRSGPSTEDQILGKLKNGQKVTILGEAEEDKEWFQIRYSDNSEAYVKSEFVTLKGEEDEAEEKETAEAATETSAWDGPVLTKNAGVVMGPSGKETYYNLDMSVIVSIMRDMGNTDEYWIREDGCKMLGDYIMCAANLNVHPRGSLVESSLGTCIVCDTGGFAAANPNQLDIATNW